jgi:glycosyltransferase involved in cell wall biosynthesis
MANLPLLSFVIPVRNDAMRLRQCLESILADPYPSERREIIVVDNGSSDRSVEVARQCGAEVLELPGLTVAELRNRGAAAARGDLLAFVDADNELAPGWTQAAASALSGVQAAAVGDQYHAPRDGTWVQIAYDALRQHADCARHVLWLGSGNVAVLASVFRDVGGFDTALVTCEDVDLCQRLRKRGLPILADPRMYSVHHGDPSTLRRLFFGELWRGRDNLRVSLRGALSWREIPSSAIPIVQLACLAGIVSGAMWSLRSRWALAAAGVAGAILLALTGLRAIRMAMNARPRPWWRFGAYCCVALVYDVTRALALVMHRGHHRR